MEGNGQRTLVRACAGLAGVQQGAITLAGRAVTQAAPLARRAAGLRIIPFERNSEGLSLSSALWENWAVRPLLLAGRLLALIDPARLRAQCDASLRQWDVRFSTAEQTAGSLSGGNAQKVILAREIDEDGESRDRGAADARPRRRAPPPSSGARCARCADAAAACC